MTPARTGQLQAEIFKTAGGVDVFRTTSPVKGPDPLAQVLSRLDSHPGAVFASGYEYPGRYSRWDIGFVDPPVELVSSGRRFALRALNRRGGQLIQILRLALEGHPHLCQLEQGPREVSGTIAAMPERFLEEQPAGEDEE